MSKEKDMHTIVIRVDRSVLRYFGEQKYYNGFVSTEGGWRPGGDDLCYGLCSGLCQILSAVLQNMPRSFVRPVSKRWYRKTSGRSKKTQLILFPVDIGLSLPLFFVS